MSMLHEYGTEKVAAARLSIASNSVLVIVKIVIGIASGSVSILSEAVHSGLDLVASLIAWFSVRESGKPADEQHQFGHGKFENVAGTIEAALIFGAAIYIIWEAVNKLISGKVEIENIGIGAVVMGASALLNYLVSRHLLKVAVKTDSVALEADALHLRTDVYTSLGVFGGLIAIKITGITMLDPLVAIVVALMIIKAAYDLTMSAFFQILDIKLPDNEEAILHEVLQGYSHLFLEYHKLRTRKSGHVRHIDMHLVVPKLMTVEEGHNLCHTITSDIEKRLDYSQILVQIEPCKKVCDECMIQCRPRN
jgi:cation diffusion facilitator family transporter